MGRLSEKLECPSKLVKRCHNQANNGLRKDRMSLSLSNVVTTRLRKAKEGPGRLRKRPELALPVRSHPRWLLTGKASFSDIARKGS